MSQSPDGTAISAFAAYASSSTMPSVATVSKRNGKKRKTPRKPSSQSEVDSTTGTISDRRKRNKRKNVPKRPRVDGDKVLFHDSTVEVMNGDAEVEMVKVPRQVLGAASTESETDTDNGNSNRNNNDSIKNNFYSNNVNDSNRGLYEELAKCLDDEKKRKRDKKKRKKNTNNKHVTFDVNESLSNEERSSCKIKYPKVEEDSDVTPELQNVEDVSDKNEIGDEPNQIIIKEHISAENGLFESDSHSVKNGKELFKWLIHPENVDNFFATKWEKSVIHLVRNCPGYYSNLLSSSKIHEALRDKPMFFTEHVDITSYNNGIRETLNPLGRAFPAAVWDYYNQGCSIRLLNPQAWFKSIHFLNATLQEYFGCLVGANVYLTPRGTQGFAPHYDDIEAFVMQIEGKKMWKIYKPRNKGEVLPRDSSGNLNSADIGSPIMQLVLEPGDLLYFPRGYIHQAEALDDHHSLHITLSMYQKNSWADLLEKLLPAALQQAIEEDVTFRRGLPIGYLSQLGLVHSDKNSEERLSFMKTLEEMARKLFKFAPIDAVADQMGKQYMADALPPYLTPNEKAHSVFGDGEIMKNGEVTNAAEFTLDDSVRLIRYNILRLLQEENATRIYYSVNNSVEYHARDPLYVEIDPNLALGVESLIFNYPNYTRVEDLPLDSDEDKLQIVSILWERGLIVTEYPLGSEDDD